MPEFQFKIGRQLFHFGENGFIFWSRTTPPGRLYFDEVEVRQVETCCRNGLRDGGSSSSENLKKRSDGSN